MTRKNWPGLGPSVVVAGGIVLSTFVAALAAKDAWLVLAGPLFLGLAVVGASVWDSRLRGRTARPSAVAWMLAGACVVAGVIVALRDPAAVKELIPTMGVAAWVAMLPPFGNTQKACR
jgi:hypothetical protein